MALDHLELMPTFTQYQGALRELAGGYTFASDPIAEDSARRLFGRVRLSKLTQPQAETLAIVAYLQPVSRPEIARIRGVNADHAVASLHERDLIEEAGRSQFGAALYRTTLTGRRVLNAGVRGYGLDQIVLRAERIVPEIKPSTVVLAFIADDILRTALAVRDAKGKPYFVPEGEGLALRGGPVGSVKPKHACNSIQHFTQRTHPREHSPEQIAFFGGFDGIASGVERRSIDVDRVLL